MCLLGSVQWTRGDSEVSLSAKDYFFARVKTEKFSFTEFPKGSSLVLFHIPSYSVAPLRPILSSAESCCSGNFRRRVEREISLLLKCQIQEISQAFRD